MRYTTSIVASLLAVPALIAGGCQSDQGVASEQAMVGNETQPQRMDVTTDRMDRDGDGMLSREEVMAANRARFDQIDADDNDQLTEQEISRGLTAERRPQADQVAQRAIENQDMDGDGTISRDEFARAADERFARVDRNRDGRMDDDELSALSPEIRAAFE